MTTIIINEKATLEAEGVIYSKSTKPVICLDNGKVYTSATDAADLNGSTVDGVSRACLGQIAHTNGKHFCYVKNVDEYLSTILGNLNKAIKENEALKMDNLALTARNSELETETTRLRDSNNTLIRQNIELTKEIKVLREQPVAAPIPDTILFKAKEYDRIMAQRKVEEKRAKLASERAKLEAMMHELTKEIEASDEELRALKGKEENVA